MNPNRYPPRLNVPQDVQMDVMETRVFDLPRGLWGSVFGLLSLASRTTYWQSDPFGVSAEDVARAISRMIGEWRMSVIPVGVILPFIGETVPDGFLLCNGEEFERAVYPELYSISPPSFVIDGERATTPDLRTRFIGGSPDSTVTGVYGGQNSFNISTAQLPVHGHAYFSPTMGATLVGEIPAIGVTGVSLSETNPTGSGAPVDNRPAFMYTEFIIRARP